MAKIKYSKISLVRTPPVTSFSIVPNYTDSKTLLGDKFFKVSNWGKIKPYQQYFSYLTVNPCFLDYFNQYLF